MLYWSEFVRTSSVCKWIILTWSKEICLISVTIWGRIPDFIISNAKCLWFFDI